MKLFFVIYVGDFNMAGPAANMKEGWRVLTTPTGTKEDAALNVELPTQIGTDKYVPYSGWKQRIQESKFPNGKIAKAMPYDM